MRFGAVVAVLALLGLGACSVETATSGLGVTSSGTAGSAGTNSTGAAGALSGAAGSTSSGAAGSSGAGGSPAGGAGGVADAATQDSDASPEVVDASTDASEGGVLACFDEDSDAGDAGLKPCSSLSYYTQMCADDAGGHAPLGASICDHLAGDIKVAASNELFDCLEAAPASDGGADACSPAHESAAADCSKKLFSRSTCAVPDGTVDGGSYGCAAIVASCPPDDGGAGGITLEQCQAWLSPFNATARQGIIECYLDPATPAGSSCADRFENECVFPP